MFLLEPALKRPYRYPNGVEPVLVLPLLPAGRPLLQTVLRTVPEKQAVPAAPLPVPHRA
jgi:hypothetical protein